MEIENIIDAHSHLWLRQDTTWNGQVIRTTTRGRSLFMGEEVQMLPPFLCDGQNTAEAFLANMDYAQVGAAVVVQEFIDGRQNSYLRQVMQRYPDRFFCCGMADFLHPGFYDEVLHLIAIDRFPGIAIPAHRLMGQPLNSDEMMRVFRLMEANHILLSITLSDGPEQVAQLREVIEECPTLKVAIGHLCMAEPPAVEPWKNDAWRQQVLLARNRNVMIESGGITWLYNSEFWPFPSAVRALREAADLVGWEHLMWGSDYPRTITAITYRMAFDFVLRSPELDDSAKRLFLGQNARAFYGFRDLPQLPYIKNMSE